MKNLSQALVKFQSQLRPVNKDSQNPFFKSSYADLSSILQAVIPLLSANGLAIIQPMRVTESGTILITRLIHDSGEHIDSEMFLPHNPDPQKYGSLISYYKRYQLQALLGISTTDEDDDANKASADYKVSRPVQQSGTAKVSPSPASDKASPAQLALLTKLNVYYSKDITKSEASALIEKANRK